MPEIRDLFGDRFASFKEEAFSVKENVAVRIPEDKPQKELIPPNTIRHNRHEDTFEKTNPVLAGKEQESYVQIGKKPSTAKNTIGKKISEDNTNAVSGNKSSFNGGKDKDLDQLEEQTVKVLEKTDRAVKAHEAAHRSAGGGLVKGGTSYEFTVGPDGKQYAVAGEVQIDVSYDLNKPEETIRKMQQVIRAALAPADPSGQDRAVASMATSIQSQARAQAQKQKSEELENSIKGNTIDIQL